MAGGRQAISGELAPLVDMHASTLPRRERIGRGVREVGGRQRGDCNDRSSGGELGSRPRVGDAGRSRPRSLPQP